MNIELQQELVGWVELLLGIAPPVFLLLLCVRGRRMRVGCWLLPVAVLLGWAGLLFVHDRYEVPLSIAAAEARHDDDFDPVNGGAALLLAGWLVPFLPCSLTLMLVYLFRACGSRLPPSVPPNNALQRTEAGDEVASDHHA